MQPYIRKDIGGKDNAILTLTVRTNSNSLQVCNINEYLERVRLKYWRALFSNKELTGRLTTNLQNKYRESVDKMADYDFTMFNIQTIIAEMNAKLIKGVEDTIMALFDRLSAEPHGIRNLLKTCITGTAGLQIRLIRSTIKSLYRHGVCFHHYSWSGTFEVSKAMEVLNDIEKALNYLDGNLTAEVDMLTALRRAEYNGQTRNIPCKYFDVDLYKKGTTHIKLRILSGRR